MKKINLKNSIILSICFCIFGVHIYASDNEWEFTNPEQEGVNSLILKKLSEEFKSGNHGYVDAFLLIKNEKIIFEQYYENDYKLITESIRDEQSKILYKNYGNGSTPQYNYFNPEWHPYYKTTNLHTIQSVSKSVTSALVGIAIERGEIEGLSTKIINYFPEHQSLFDDPLKKSITIENLLTMTAGIKWDESTHAYTDPRNNAASMENSYDWIKYILNQPMEFIPGDTFVYNSGITVLISYILYQATGMQADEYAEKYLFNALNIKNYFWKKTPKNFTDTEGGLYLSTRDFAKIGLLYLNNGKWKNTRIIKKEWSELTMSPDTEIEGSDRKYGFQWWLVPYGNTKDKWMYSGSGYGGQYLMIIPEYDLVMVFNGWNVFDIPRPSIEYLSERVIQAIQ